MAEFSLRAEPFLGGYDEGFDRLRLTEVTDLAIVSLAPPLGQEAALAAAFKDAYGADWPAPGETTTSANGDTRFLGIAGDQIFALFPRPAGLASRAVAEKLGDAAYLTEQSDNWVLLRLDGPPTLAVLERMIPLDLAQFHVGTVARTLMEHLGVSLLREAPDRFLLMSASSSASSFLHALETAIGNVTALAP
ncbi:sarcosine oxidase subunit gamma [Rhodobium orientis]|uniref:sarcosine oxidase subunit gamma n=1 Tax=Rhodobium orientis TaxID=34017 RepID=UPI001474701F|nr:sarcosine oxidase subunit gamma [Rhodobium orientis]MBB4302408.1 sarcosine oxidase subunit gamma [Rhodobium orientis]